MAPRGPQYDELPQYRNSGAINDVWRMEAERYLEDGEDLDDERVREAIAQRRRDAYLRKKQERMGSGVTDIYPGRYAADLIDRADDMAWYMRGVWHTHNISFWLNAVLAIGMFVFIAVYHWADGRGIGKFPLEDNFVRDVGGRPINADHQIEHVHFGYILIWIPVAGMLYHGSFSMFGYMPFGVGRTFDAIFVTYFYDNLLHHMGSAKYLYYSFVYAIITGITLVLVGVVDIFLAISFGLIGATVFILLHSGDWQFGKNMVNYRVNLKKAKTDAIMSMAKMTEKMPSSLFSGGKVSQDCVERVANIVGAPLVLAENVARDVTDSAVTVADNALGLTQDIVMRFAMFPEALVAGIANAVDKVVPPGQVPTVYIWAAVLQMFIHATIIVYYAEAVSNAGFSSLEWFVTFAFVMHFVPTIMQLVVYVVYALDYEMFSVYAAKEIALISGHTIGILAFVAVVFFGSLDTSHLGVIYT